MSFCDIVGDKSEVKVAIRNKCRASPNVGPRLASASAANLIHPRQVFEGVFSALVTTRRIAACGHPAAVL